MSATALAGGIYGVAKNIGFDPISWISGKKEKGSGLTQPDTLAHAIDKLDEANDYEAIELAKQSLKLKLQGESNQGIAEFIGSSLGYGPGEVYNSRKWSYINRTLNSEFRQMESEINRRNSSFLQSSQPPASGQEIYQTAQPSDSQLPPAQTAQVGLVQQSNIKWAVAGAVALILLTLGK